MHSPIDTLWLFLDRSDRGNLHHGLSTFGVKDDVLGFDVPMDHLLVVHVLQSLEDAGRKESGLLFVEFVFFADVVAQIPSWHQVQNKVKSISVLEGLSHAHNQFVFQPFEQFSFVADGLVALLGKNPE